MSINWYENNKNDDKNKSQLQITADLDAKTMEFMNTDRSKNCKERDKTETKKFIRHAISHCNLNSDDLSIVWMKKHNRIHEDLLNDKYLANFLTHEFEWHKLKGNKLEPNLRPAKAYVVTSIKRHGRDIVKFPKLLSTWDGITRNDDYIKSKNHAQAPSATLAQHIKIKKATVYNAKGNYDHYVIMNRDGYGQMYGTMLRGNNIHKLDEENVSRQNPPASVLYRPWITITTDKTKTCDKPEEWIVVCECPPNQEHSDINLECPVTIQLIHAQLKRDDYDKYIKNKSIPYNKLPYFRRPRYISNSDKSLGVYFDIQRRGEKHIRGCMEFMAKHAGIKTDEKFTC